MSMRLVLAFVVPELSEVGLSEDALTKEGQLAFFHEFHNSSRDKMCFKVLTKTSPLGGDSSNNLNT